MIACSENCGWRLPAHWVCPGEPCPACGSGVVVETSREDGLELLRRMDALPPDAKRDVLLMRRKMPCFSAGEWKEKESAPQPLIDRVTFWEGGERRWDFDALQETAREWGVSIGKVIHEARQSCGDCLSKARRVLR